MFYSGITGFYPDTEEEADERGRSARHQLRQSNKRDLVPLIPPVAEKSAFYRSHLVKTLWRDFAQALETATDVYFVGYSLPKTDLSMRLFLTGILGESGKTIKVVNRNNSSEIRENYHFVLPGCRFRDDYWGHSDAVELMVSDLNHESESNV